MLNTSKALKGLQRLRRKISAGMLVAVTASFVAGCGGNSYNQAGSFDKTFGTGSADGTPDGIVSLSLGAGNDFAKAMAVQVDGKMVVVGSSTSNAAGGSSNIVVQRFNTNGTLDTSFGVGTADGSPDGVVTLDLGSNTSDAAVGVKLQADGKIVVTGTSTPAGGTSNIILARLNTNGTLDASFGADNSDGTPDGVVSIDLGAYRNDVANALAIQSDGKIIVAGSTTISDSKNIVLARVNANGTLDITFGEGVEDGTPYGVVSISLGDGDDVANGLAIQANGKIVVAGTTKASDGTSNAAVARLNTDGTLDSAFGTGTSDGTPDGVVSVSFGASNDAANDLVIQPDGKILVVGTTTATDGSTNVAVARLTSTGELDVAFGADSSDGTPNGVVGLSFGSGNDVGTGIAIQSDGRILISGYTVASDKSVNAIVARMLNDGKLDKDFGTSADDGTPEGVVGISLGAGNDYAHAIAVQADGMVLVMGDRTLNDSSDIWLARLMVN